MKTDAYWEIHYQAGDCSLRVLFKLMLSSFKGHSLDLEGAVLTAGKYPLFPTPLCRRSATVLRHFVQFSQFSSRASLSHHAVPPSKLIVFASCSFSWNFFWDLVAFRVILFVGCVLFLDMSRYQDLFIVFLLFCWRDWRIEPCWYSSYLEAEE